LGGGYDLWRQGSGNGRDVPPDDISEQARLSPRYAKMRITSDYSRENA
jgi:hypothetical protein